MGNLVWQESFGGPLTDEAYAIDAAAGGDLLVAGSTFSAGAGYSDYWVLRLDGAGNIVWERTYGDSYMGYAYSVEEAYDGRVLVGGTADSPDLGTGLWVLRLNDDGTLDPFCTQGVSTGFTAVATTASASYSGIPSTPLTGATTDTLLVGSDVPVAIAEQCPACGGALPGEVSPPGAMQPLVFADPTTLLWEDTSAQGAVTYNVYSAPIHSILSGWGWCSQEGLSTTFTQDPYMPKDGEVWFYLVTGENAAGEGPLGTTSWGASRVAARPCR